MPTLSFFLSVKRNALLTTFVAPSFKERVGTHNRAAGTNAKAWPEMFFKLYLEPNLPSPMFTMCL